MNRKIKIGNGLLVNITDKMYKAAGGEAEIYVNSGQAFKFYHDPDKKMLPPSKMKELATIGNPQIVVPQEVIYDAANGKPLGYTTKFVDNAEPLLKLFTRTFKEDNNVDATMINALVKQMQLTTADVHKANCLIVDLNELNILVNINSVLTPWFIDTDSYATPSFKATAIMDSVRDRRVTAYDKQGNMQYNPDALSDWFSFGILAFWLYTNIHPFRGNHNSYKPRDKGKQMDDGISVFHTGVRVPPSVNDFNIIPKRHLDWFKDMFKDGRRSIPPLPDSTVPFVVPTQIVTIKGTDKLEVVEVASYPDHILYVFQCMGVQNVVTKTHLYSGKKEIIGWDKAQKVILCPTTEGTIISGTLKGTTVSFAEMKSGVPFGTIQGRNMFQRNNCIYTMSGGKLIENSFTSFGSKIVHRTKELENISQLTATMYDGCIIQDLLGKKYLTLPYKKEFCFSKYIPNLDGFRVVDAKSDKTVTVVLAERGGVYHKFVIVFDKSYQNFEVREVKDIAYDEINFAVMENGLCVLLSSPTEMELFVKANQFETLTDPPFDANMKLFATVDGFFFTNGNSIHQLKRK
jgi:hypothetical protein